MTTDGLVPVPGLLPLFHTGAVHCPLSSSHSGGVTATPPIRAAATRPHTSLTSPRGLVAELIRTLWLKGTGTSFFRAHTVLEASPKW